MNRTERRRQKRAQKRTNRTSRLTAAAVRLKHDRPGKWRWSLTELGEQDAIRKDTMAADGLGAAIKAVEHALDHVPTGLYMLAMQSPTGKLWRKCWSTLRGGWARSEEAEEYLKEKRRAAAHAVEAEDSAVAEAASGTAGAAGSEPGATEMT